MRYHMIWRYDAIWYDMMIWYDIWYMIYDIWHMTYDVMWCDTIRYGIWYDTIRHDMTWYDMIWYDMIWYDMIWYDMIWYDLIWYDMIWACCELVCYNKSPMNPLPRKYNVLQYISWILRRLHALLKYNQFVWILKMKKHARGTFPFVFHFK